MTATPLDTYMNGLQQAANEANVAEEALRKDMMRRVKAMEQERAFAFRRLNLMRDVTAAIAGAKDEAEAVARGSAVMLREIGWNGASKAQKEVVERFGPVIVALREAAAPLPKDDANAAIVAALRDFEQWYAVHRNGPFLALMEREPLELPLVEI
ncbi:MAG: hypothetical protein IT562_24595 [Alphaproteobacteria bacterium]|nr:hypothetical protein [Alphaproteobacteria bacterium]